MSDFVEAVRRLAAWMIELPEADRPCEHEYEEWGPASIELRPLGDVSATKSAVDGTFRVQELRCSLCGERTHKTTYLGEQ